MGSSVVGNKRIPYLQDGLGWVESFDWAMMRHLCASRQAEQGQVYMRDGRMRRVRAGRGGQVRIDSNFAQEIERNFGISRRLVELARDSLTSNKSKRPNRRHEHPALAP